MSDRIAMSLGESVEFEIFDSVIAPLQITTKQITQLFDKDGNVTKTEEEVTGQVEMSREGFQALVSAVMLNGWKPTKEDEDVES